MTKIPDNCFDFLRLFFACIVVFAHFFVLSGDHNLAYLVPIFNTKVAISGFFVLSGFLVSNSYFRSNNWKHYAIKRAKRLLPAYIFILFFAVIIGAFFGTLSVKDYFTNSLVYRYLGCNLLFLNFLQPNLPFLFTHNIEQAVNGSLWTIKIEVAFYFVLPFFLFLFEKIPSKLAKNVGLIILYVIFILLNSYFLKHPSILANIYLKQLPGQLPYFLVGIFAFYNLSFINKNSTIILLIGLPLFLEKFIFQTTYLWAIGLGALVFYIGFRMLFLSKLTIHGDFSYGIYISHFLFCQIIFSELWDYNRYLQFFLLILLTSLFSLFSWKYIEQPFLHKKPKLNP